MLNWPEYDEENIQPRKTISPYWVLVAILTGVCLAMALWSGKVRADSPTLIAQDPQGNWIRLHDEPCAAATAWFKLRRAEMFYQGKNYGACWRVEGGAVLVFDDNGDFSMVPVQAFHREPAA